jgi:hypothetical protein
MHSAAYIENVLFMSDLQKLAETQTNAPTDGTERRGRLEASEDKDGAAHPRSLR